ncbi:hypothetical protein LINPERHAP1_LOCUS26052 [Linum perenne]
MSFVYFPTDTKPKLTASR